MAQQDLDTLTGASYFGVESTFGTTPSMTRIFPRVGGTLTAQQTIIPTTTLQEKLVKRDKSKRGYRSCGVQVTCDAFIDGTRLTSAGSASTTWLGAMLKAVLGGESAAAGSTIAAGSSASSIVAASGHGARFPVGQVFLCDVGDVPEVMIAKAVSTDTITPLHHASASLTTGQDLINCHCYYLTNTNAQSATFQHALGADSSHQWTLNGLTGGMSVDLSRDANLAYTFDLTGANFTGPSAQSISVAAGTNSLVGPVPNVGAVCLLQSLSTTTRVHYPLSSVSLTIEPGNSHVRELGGSTQGVVGVMRNAMPSVTAQVSVRSDLDQYTAWDSDTDYVLVYAIPVGSGATKRWTGFVLYCNIEPRPSRGNEDGAERTQLTLRGRHNTMQSAVTTDLALSPLVIFEG